MVDSCKEDQSLEFIILFTQVPHYWLSDFTKSSIFVYLRGRVIMYIATGIKRTYIIYSNEK